MVRPSPSPGAELGVFATTFISKEMQLGPYKGDTVAMEDIGDHDHTTNAREVRNCMSLCMKVRNCMLSVRGGKRNDRSYFTFN